jgi:hypothetical protein
MSSSRQKYALKNNDDNDMINSDDDILIYENNQQSNDKTKNNKDNLTPTEGGNSGIREKNISKLNEKIDKNAISQIEKPI